MKKLLLLLLVLMLAGCGSAGKNQELEELHKKIAELEKFADEKESMQPLPTQKPKITAAAEKDTTTLVEKGTVDKIDMETKAGKIVYKKHEIAKSYDGNPVLIAYFDFTSDLDEPASVTSAFYTRAYQSGVECDTTFSLSEDNKAIDDYYTDVRNGTTIEVALGIVLSSDIDDVIIRTEEFHDFTGEYQEQIINLSSANAEKDEQATNSDEDNSDYAEINKNLNEFFKTNHADAGKNEETDALKYVTSLEYNGKEVHVNVLADFRDMQSIEKEMMASMIQGAAMIYVMDAENPLVPVRFYDSGEYCGGNKSDDVENFEWL